MIVRLAGSLTPHQASGPQVGVLRQSKSGHFCDFSHFLYDKMVTQLNKVHSGSKLFAYASILCRIMHERVVLLRPVMAVPPRGVTGASYEEVDSGDAARWRGHGGALLERHD